MEVATVLHLLTAATSLIGVFFSLRSAIEMSSTDIAQIASTRWDYNPAIVRSLASQKTDAVTGVTALLVVFVLEVASLALDLGEFPSLSTGLIVFAVASGLLFGVGTFLRREFRKAIHRKALERLPTEKVGKWPP